MSTTTMSTNAISMEPKNWISWGFVILAVIAAVIAAAVGGVDAIDKLLPFYGIGFGALLILDGIFFWRLFVVVRDTSETEYRWSCGIIGAIFMVLGILELAGVTSLIG